MKLLRYSTLSFLLVSTTVFAARPVNLHHQPINYLNSFKLPPTLSAANNQDVVGYKQISQDLDFNKTTHIRISQTYAGFPVWGADAVVHISGQAQVTNKNLLMANADKNNTTMNGTFYEDLSQDLQSTPTIVFEPAQAQKALANALNQVKHSASAENKQANLFVYVDDNNKAHWVFHVSFQIEENDQISQPNFLMDALSFQIYQQWDNVKTLDNVKGGGIGGNPKLGKLSYDGLKGDLAALDIQRDPESATCYLQNDLLSVANYNSLEIVSYPCYQPDKNHNKVYWNKKTSDAVNGGYSPNDDSYFAGIMLQQMYKELYGLDVLTKNGKPMPLHILTHKKMENAEWIEGKDVMVIGDGQTIFYPLASIGVIAHEVSHGFTAQHSRLMYYGQSGGINEAFSDMATQVVDQYAYGHNNWQVGYEIMKANNSALRYLDHPSKDCNGEEPGNSCSIEDAQSYRPNMNVHNSSGVFNRAFYLLATSPDWNVKKAFGVMIQANSNYWTQTSNFKDAACGVVEAAKDYKYSTGAVRKAFTTVGVDLSDC